MTGAQYGGASYGGFRWSGPAGSGAALVDGTPVRIETVELTPQTISVTAQVTRSRADTLTASVGSRVGDYRVVQQAGGQYRVEPTDGSALVTLTLPPPVTPPEPETQSVGVEGYDVETVAPEWREVSMTFQRDRAPSPGDVAHVDSGATWAIDIGSHTTLALPPEAVGQVARQGGPADPALSLPLRLLTEEVWALRQAGRVAAVLTRTVPDGDGFTEDTTSNGAQTATVDAPTGAAIEDGDYAIAAWTLTRQDGARRPWRVSLTMRPL